MATSALNLSTRTELDATLRAFAASPSVARSLTSFSVAIGITQHTERLSDDELVDFLVQCPQLRVFLLQRWRFLELNAHNVDRLVEHHTFQHLLHFTIGWTGNLKVSSMFRLLSVMPSLRSLHFGCVMDDVSEMANFSSVIPTPACRLKELEVSDDRGVNFLHYAHLLSNSHDTLESARLSWIDGLDVPVEEAIVEALARCTRLRSLESIGNGISTARLIAACPRLECLSVAQPPTEEEIGALSGDARGLRELRFVRIYYADADLDVVWDDLKDALALLPSIRILRLVFSGDLSRRSPSCYADAVTECAKRRIHLSTSKEGYIWF
ncbi:hypothetical protein EXIGLDRAFT_722903 [Exidia glandulosa HHB12029]|uniref:RNI-like protein n=1 Tax=Exidia glandulosa HHB12029 TaxID=1314781 RepID=A0A165F242_EXIGL|nr:hypothetical protein EXIGLDRAFT_722903 [Exidia glandulosa HHB12029]